MEDYAAAVSFSCRASLGPNTTQRSVNTRVNPCVRGLSEHKGEHKSEHKGVNTQGYGYETVKKRLRKGNRQTGWVRLTADRQEWKQDQWVPWLPLALPWDGFHAQALPMGC